MFKVRLSRKYFDFYLAGRADAAEDAEKHDLIDTSTLDFEELAKIASAGPDDVHAVLVAACSPLVEPLRVGTEKKDWIEDNQEGITLAGGDKTVAYDHYLKGVIDEAAWSLEEGLLEQLDVNGADPDDGDDEDEDDEDGEKGEGDEGEEEDDAPDAG